MPNALQQMCQGTDTDCITMNEFRQMYGSLSSHPKSNSLMVTTEPVIADLNRLVDRSNTGTVISTISCRLPQVVGRRNGPRSITEELL